MRSPAHSTVRISDDVTIKDDPIGYEGGVLLKTATSQVYLANEEAVSLAKNLFAAYDLCGICLSQKKGECDYCDVFYCKSCTREHDYCHLEPDDI